MLSTTTFPGFPADTVANLGSSISGILAKAQSNVLNGFAKKFAEVPDSGKTELILKVIINKSSL